MTQETPNPRPARVRVALFTDTLADVNGVSRFIRNVAEQSLAFGHDLTAVTSTRLTPPDLPNVVNVRPLYARAMPGYPQLELALPSPVRITRELARLRPDAVHISTPGPVGTMALRAARKLGVPILGTYHTDFPAYIEHLFNDVSLTWVCRQNMRWFYTKLARVFTRSADYADKLVALGVERERILRLSPGIDTDAFHVRFKDAGVWSGYEGVEPGAVKALYVGRVSVEKNLPLLTRLWPRVRRACPDAQLIIVGDGPYRAQMERELSGHGAVFLGFKHGVELSTIYASSDLFIFPSLTDTLGQVVMEAQSAGLPVLVSNVGGPSEVVDDGRTGWVLAADEPDAWADRAVTLIKDASLRASVGEAGHRKIQPMSIRGSFEHFWGAHEQVALSGRAVGA